jgi:polyhydroxybutyrate depolymerase
VVAIAAAAALLLAGCALRPGTVPGASGVAGGSAGGAAGEAAGGAELGVQHTIVSGGQSRTYLLTVPAGVPRNAPLVVMLHGGFGSGSQAEKDYGWDELAASAGFIVAYPDGQNHAWNAGGGCCGAPGRQGTDDVAFITAVVADIEASHSIDPAKVFATGMSNGAMMSYRLACDTSIFAAIAPVAGTIVGTCDSPKPRSALEIHGLADDSVRMDGQPGSGIVKVSGMPVEDANALWRTADDCAAPAVSTVGLVTTSMAGCPDGRAVELITIAGAGHQWPGSTVVRPGAAPPSTALDATSTIWKFFTAHSG